MKMMKKNFITTFALMLFTVIAIAQDKDEELSLSNGSIDDQFEYVLQKANNYRNYKVVKKEWLSLLKKNTLDSVARIEKELAESNSLTITQKDEIEKLKKDLASTNTNLNQVTEEKDSISFFGILIEKPVYKSIMWGIIGLLTLVLVFFIYKFKNANAITQDARKSLSELEQEYEEHRRKALEREQKARRALQDEINKQKMAKTK
ncbi:tRNA (guanine-N1)-methyltransferase [Robertkochia solimangrovi]|uniref:tRNA (guanine-N1)-methyltransferase n=1 Tax=Robertkochia solimangrovi TaxID=2213046 RepID=UPI00117E8F69|nr:tRNA (guanine-N1)-methyltransferase [Robertkochia solimangrovi]TRZ41053.1 tRNA (guanine-N1)-methyltransferase [Robertkochia solimangrovi]